MKKILVTGGAGYIGSITSRVLSESGYIPIIFDNFEAGHRQAVKGFDLYEGDLRNFSDIDEVVKQVKPDAVMHFAAYINVGESVNNPLKYFENNVGGSLNLFKSLINHGVKTIVFSSTAATYGKPATLPITEETSTRPINPYGVSKLLVEQILEDLTKQGLNSIRLRYFNVAGAWSDGSLGEDHNPETHIIPMIIFNALGKRKEFILYGDDYDTQDGTNIRDYVHVFDLAQAHIDALKNLETFSGSEIFNVGVGKGYSNKQIIDKVKIVTGLSFEVKIGKRRPGDPAVLYTDSTKLQKKLGWVPKFGLKEIIKSAWSWHNSHPDGYHQ